jgi:4-hydroxy-tetrahydrodipicolinate synthase|tara:strand:- start:134 stop:1015 length:882 start_codon:yes stop_codon:yes gene_type:complete
MELIMFQGCIVALVTPMNSDGSVDVRNFRNLLDFHVDNKTDGIVILGTTGECPTIDFDEHTFLVKEAVSHISGKIPIIAGTGANSTKEAIYLTQSAKEVGADACLLVTPYYNKPNQNGLFEHYKAINDAVDIPQILYNVPSRTGCDLKNETVISLSQLSNIIGIKDATGELERINFLKNKVEENFIFISGDDLSFLEYMKRGGQGVISVTANITPDLMHTICSHILKEDVEKAENINEKLRSLHKAMFIDSNPIPVKWLLNHLGLIKQGIRLPLVELDKKYHSVMIEAYEAIK